MLLTVNYLPVYTSLSTLPHFRYSPDKVTTMNTADTEQLLQVLRNITREHMRLLAHVDGCHVSNTKDVMCVHMSLQVMKKHNFKQDNPL